MKRILTYLFLITAFSSCISYSGGWNGSSSRDFTNGEFVDLNGRQAFKIVVPNDDTYLKYSVAVDKGEIKAGLKSSSRKVLDDKPTSSEEGSVHLLNEKGKTYTFYVKGNHATGKFNVRFEGAGK